MARTEYKWGRVGLFLPVHCPTQRQEREGEENGHCMPELVERERGNQEMKNAREWFRGEERETGEVGRGNRAGRIVGRGVSQVLVVKQ